MSYVPARDGCSLLLGATVPPYYGLNCVFSCSFFFTHRSLLTDTKCSFMVPLLSFSNSQCESDNTTHSGDFLLLVVCLFVNCTAWGKVKPMWVVWIEGSHISLKRFKINAEKTGVIGPVLSLFCTVPVWWFMSCSFPGKHTYLFDLLPGLLQLL